ncbi:MAG TPA: 3'-5' exonuclease [Anaeromyxobacteraceae bacterium]|nr:3'-5' exonuclease [Anaeromyxobacteraceae bacterium]
MRRYLALDLETVPDEDLVAAVDAEPDRPYPDKLGRLLAARRAQSGGRSDFLPLPYHRPVVACSLEAVERDGALVVAEVGCWTDRRGSEEAFLARTWDRLTGRTLVTFHGRGFDLPVLELRSLKLGLSLPAPHRGGPPAGQRDHDDLFDLLTNGGSAPAAPLDLYAKLVGLPGKESVAGKDVSLLYAQGALDRIAGYCMSDVVQTWLLYLRYRLLDGTLTPAAYAVSVASCREELPGMFAERLDPAASSFLTGFLGRCAPFFEELPAAPLRKAL